MIPFRERKELNEVYKAWLEEHPSVADCSFNVLSFLEINGNLKRSWIPCSDTLPAVEEEFFIDDLGQPFLVTVKGAAVATVLYFDGSVWCDEEQQLYNVIAWQPLPDVYEGF